MKELLRKLVQADSTVEKGESAVAQVICEALGVAGIEAHIDSWNGNRANLVARVQSAGHKAGLLFACHLDVVPAGEVGWSKPPFDAVESDGRIYGRGSADMKGPIAAVVTAIRQVAESGTRLQGDIIFFGAAGEESDSCGAARFMGSFGRERPELAGVVLTEPTDFEAVTAHRGMLWLEIATRGKSAHGSAPQLGVNAISSMKSLLDELDNYSFRCKPHRLLGQGSLSVNTISGGQAINVVADKCSIGVDIRTLPGQSHQQIINDLQQMFAILNQKAPEFDAQINVIREVGALETNAGCDFVKAFCSAVGVGETMAVGFTTDGPHFVPLGAPVVIFGPGKPDLCHKPDEYIDIADVEKAVGCYKEIILRFLAD
ncbi:MAG: M20 family metallopeptidase [Planctomycetota bacterium]